MNKIACYLVELIMLEIRHWSKVYLNKNQSINQSKAD